VIDENDDVRCYDVIDENDDVRCYDVIDEKMMSDAMM